MDYFDSLLRKRGLSECPLPLWKLKITDEEFMELRELLELRTHDRNMDNPFISVCRESTLFFAEFWRRLYTVGSHSMQMVYDALESRRTNVNFCEEFFSAALRGAKCLKIERYSGGKSEHLNDMLYQGGLPMKLVTSNISNSVWDRFTRGLVNRRINFEELNLGIIASQSDSMRTYCEQLIVGVEAERYTQMPFFCKNENDAWYLYLIQLAKEEKNRRHQLHPFSLSWEFTLDTVEKKIYTNYCVKGLQRLPQVFLEEYGLHCINFFSVQVRKNGQAVDTFDYANNFCRYAVNSKHPYTNGDYISVFLHNQNEPHLGDTLDMSIPHLLYRNKDGKYDLGNQIGRQDSLLLIPGGWELVDPSRFQIDCYTWGEIHLTGVIIPSDFTENILVKGDDGAITFGLNTPLYWTEMQTHPLYQPNVIESVYDASKCLFTLCHDTEDGMDSRRRNVEYRNKWQNSWSEKPSFGEIFARAIDTNGNYVTPIRFINVGDGLVISLQHADKDSCLIRVSWPYGHVSTKEGERKVNDVWEIKKDNCKDSRRISFTFTPDGNSHNQFSLSIKAPFKDFSIMDIYGESIENDCWIPYSDVDKYQYHLVGQDVKEYVFGNVRRELRWKGDKLYIVEEGKLVKSVPYEGSLLSLFGSRELLCSLLERTSQNMLKAEIKVSFTLSDGKKTCFSIKESPFRPRQNEDGCVVITGNNFKPVKYTGVLKLIKLDEPTLDSVEMPYNEEAGTYILPKSILPWGKTILIGRTRGRICPALVNLAVEMNSTYRQNNRETAITEISKQLAESSLGDEFWQRVLGWFNRSLDDDIPAGSILELLCTAKNYKYLLCLAFQLYAKCAEEERDILKEKLKSFSNDLAFQWYWLQPYLSGLFSHLSPFIGGDLMSSAIQEVYIKWAMNQGIDIVKYLSALNNPDEYHEYIGQCLISVLNSFSDWMSDLCVSSMVEAYDSISQGLPLSLAQTIVKEPKKIFRFDKPIDVSVEASQEYLGEEVSDFFDKFGESGKYGNEIWFFKRVNAVAAHINKEIDLFDQKDEVRRSIIFCSKSSNPQFVTALYNKLSL